MIVTGDNETPQGVATYDLSDPRNPILLDSIRTTADGTPLIKAYDSVPVWGTYVILAQNGDTTAQRGVDIIDFSDPKNLKHVGRFDFEGRTRYAQFQDHYMFIGDAKVDMNTFETVATYPNGGGEYTLPIGNLLVTAGMHRPDNGRIWCHQSLPDTTPPKVHFTSPEHNAAGVAVTGRVGIVIPETLDIKTINDTNIVLRPLHQAQVAVDIVSSDHDVINITPKNDLKANTTYELIIPAGGVSDIAGNTFAEDFRLVFSTGDAINTKRPPVISSLTVTPETCVGCAPISVNVKASAAPAENANINLVNTSNTVLTTTVSWGDGSESQKAGAEQFEHEYAAPGIFTVHVKVTDANGLSDQSSRRVIVTGPVTHNSRHSSTIYAEPDYAGPDSATADQRLVWNVNPDNHSLTATDFASQQLRYEIPMPKNPRSLTADSQGNIWVVSEDEPSVSVVSAKGQLITTLQLPHGSRPQAIVHHPVLPIAYISAMGIGEIIRVDTQALKVIDKLPVGPWPKALAITGDGNKLFATRFISPDHQGEVYVVDTATFDRARVIPLAIDTHPDSDRNGRGVPNYLAALAIAPDGKALWVGSNKANIFRGGMRDGKALSFENSVRSIISFIDIAQEVELSEQRMDVDNHELPSAIDFDARGAIAYVSFRGNNHVTAYDANTLQVLDRLQVPSAPIGVVVDSADHVYVHSYLARTVTKAGNMNGANGSLGAFALINAQYTVSNETLAPLVLRGKQLFNDAQNARISRDGYISCASCHFDGEHDGRTWDFSDRGEGLRNTIDLRGKAGTAHGRLHWSANFDEVQDFEHDIRGAFAGRGLLADSDLDSTNHPLDATKAARSQELDALAAYAASLSKFGISPYRKANQQLSTLGEQGKALFESLNCTQCHNGEAFTDSTKGLRHNVGTLKITSGMRLNADRLNAIDTPTLKGLWSTAPYFHDGSAASLLDVLDQPSHGNAQTLSVAQKEQLIAYLLQIDDLESFADIKSATTRTLALTSIEPNATQASRFIPLEINASDDVIQVTYFANDHPIATSDTPPFKTTWLTDSPGRQRLYAIATYPDGRQTATSDVWANIEGNSLTCEIGQTQHWTGGFVAKDIKVTNVGPNTMRDWQVKLEFNGDVVYRESWDTIVQQQGNRKFIARGYTDDRDLKPGEAISFGFIANHQKEPSTIEPTCIVSNPIIPEAKPVVSQDSDLDGVTDPFDACADTPFGAMINKIGCTVPTAQPGNTREHVLRHQGELTPGV